MWIFYSLMKQLLYSIISLRGTMTSYNAFENCLNRYKIKYKRDFPMSRFVTFKAGGSADIFVMPESVSELKNAILSAKECGVDSICVGSGSNLLVRDGGYRGAVICVLEMNDISSDETLVTAECGARLSAVTSYALSKSLRGFEFAGGIPGTVGGGVYMNAGAYGGEIKDVIEYADVIDEAGNISRRSAGELGLSYRHSSVMDDGGIIVSAAIRLVKGDAEEGRAIVKDLNKRRRDKQPLDFPSAGSTFKRPEGYFAGALIDEAGLKGFSVGGAAVSEKNVGFVINTGGATAADIESLICAVKKRVFETSRVNLELEVRIIGEKA